MAISFGSDFGDRRSGVSGARGNPWEMRRPWRFRRGRANNASFGAVAAGRVRSYAAGGVAAMLRIWELVLGGWFVVSAGVAQTFTEGIAKAQVEIDAERWSAALAGLLNLREAAAG